MERLSLADLQSFELQLNSMSPLMRPEPLKLVPVTYQRHPKPPYTYVGLIATAIQSSQARKLTLADIHDTLGRMFPFFRDARYTGWKDSVRHNLSRHDCFQMELKDPARKNGKGNFWKVDMTKVNSDMFKRQQTTVARKGNWATDLHHQLGIPPLVFREPPTSPLSHLKCLPQRPTTSRKRKFAEDTSMSCETSEPPASKRHKPFINANILQAHQPATTAAKRIRAMNTWVVPQEIPSSSSWHQSSTMQASDDPHRYGSSSRVTTFRRKTASHEIAEPAQYAELFGLCLRDFQCPSFDGLPALESLSSPATNISDTTVTSLHSPEHSIQDLPACSMTSRSDVSTNFWATAALPREVRTECVQLPSFAEVYKPDDLCMDYLYPSIVRQEH